MMKHNFIPISLMLLILGIAPARGQNITASAGGEAGGTGGAVSFTVGQLTYNGLSGADGSVSQGVQQAYEIFVVTDTRDLYPEFSARAFPNPATNEIRLGVSRMFGKQMRYALLDLQGRFLSAAQIDDLQTSVPLQEFADGIYFLQVFIDHTNVQTFKIIKNN